MNPPADVATPDLSALRIDLLRRAIAIYLEIAYGGAEPPEAIRRRLEWGDGTDPAAILTRPPFERATRPGPDQPAVFALRLGNARYPHMKFQVQPWANASGFMLAVNTHDQVMAFDPKGADADAFRALQEANQRYKDEIELAWDREGLPTFLRYLRDYINAHSRPKEGETAGGD